MRTKKNIVHRRHSIKRNVLDKIKSRTKKIREITLVNIELILIEINEEEIFLEVVNVSFHRKVFLRKIVFMN